MKITIIALIILIIFVLGGAVYYFAIPRQVIPTPPLISQPAEPSTPVNGICGSSLNSCTQGTFQDVANTNTAYIWSCLGSNGGVTASCSLAKPPATLSNVLDRIEAAIRAKLKI